jgi:hypothetical protein
MPLVGPTLSVWFSQLGTQSELGPTHEGRRQSFDGCGQSHKAVINNSSSAPARPGRQAHEPLVASSAIKRTFLIDRLWRTADLG